MEIAEDSGGLQTTLREVADRIRENPSRSAITSRRIVYSAATAYALLFAGAAASYYLGFQEARLDLGNMVQAIWSTSHGHLLEYTTTGGHQASRLGSHVDPFLVLLVPLWWIWSSPVALLVLQAAAVASGVLPVYWLARKHLSSDRAATHFAFAYLLYPATQYNAFTLGTGFHSVSLAVPLILYAIWFLDEDRLLSFAIVAVLAASTKEEIALAVGCLGIWYAVRKGRRVTGAAIFCVGVAVFLVNFLVIIPHFTRAGLNPFEGRYENVGGSPGGMVRIAVSDPIAFVHAIASWHKLIFVVILLVPFFGLWLLEPLLFLGAIPDLAINLLSSKPEQTTIQFHYTAGIIPFLFAASIFGAAKLKRDHDRISFYALAGAACLALYSPIYFAAGDIRQAFPSNGTHVAKTRALELIPPGVPVSASSRLAAYLSDRREIYVFPVVRKSSWVVLEKGDSTYGDHEGYRRVIREIDVSRHWKLVYSVHGVQVLRRTGQR
jgi:uncharacterized membrane protein